MCKHMAEKNSFGDAKKSNFNEQMEFQKKSTIILANFGGPRSLEEVPVFLTSLLTDVDVIRSPFPRFFEKWFDFFYNSRNGTYRNGDNYNICLPRKFFVRKYRCTARN